MGCAPPGAGGRERMVRVETEHKESPTTKYKTVEVCLWSSRGGRQQQLSSIWGRSESLQCQACPAPPHPDTETAEHRSPSPGGSRSPKLQPADARRLPWETAGERDSGSARIPNRLRMFLLPVLGSPQPPPSPRSPAQSVYSRRSLPLRTRRLPLKPPSWTMRQDGAPRSGGPNLGEPARLRAHVLGRGRAGR